MIYSGLLNKCLGKSRHRRNIASLLLEVYPDKLTATDLSSEIGIEYESIRGYIDGRLGSPALQEIGIVNVEKIGSTVLYSLTEEGAEKVRRWFDKNSRQFQIEFGNFESLEKNDA